MGIGARRRIADVEFLPRDPTAPRRTAPWEVQWGLVWSLNMMVYHLHLAINRMNTLLRNVAGVNFVSIMGHGEEKDVCRSSADGFED